MSYTAYEQKAILGRLLMDIVHDDLTDDTIGLVKQLDRDETGVPLGAWSVMSRGRICSWACVKALSAIFWMN